MSAQAQLTFQEAGGGAPHRIALAPGQDLHPYSVVARWDGSGASGAFHPCLSIYSQSGVLLSRTRPAQIFAAGDEGVVTYGPFLGDAEAAAGSAGSGTNPVDLRNPSVGAYFVAASLTNFTMGRWEYTNGVLTNIRGWVRVPEDATTVAILAAFQSSTTATGNVVIDVATRAVADGGNVDGALTAEATQTLAITGSIKYATFPTSGGLASNPAPADMLAVSITRTGTSGSDTLAVPLVLWGAWLVAA